VTVYREGDRLGRFFPALLGLTVVAAVLELAASFALDETALATAGLSTALFAVGVAVAGYQVRAGRPVQARILLACTVTLFGAVGAYLVPGVELALALLPVVSVVLVLPHIPRKRLVLISAAAVASSVAILVVDEAIDRAPAVPGLAGVIFQDAILIGVLILVLAGLADFAMAARDSLRQLHESTERHLGVATARLSIMAALHVMRTLPTPEATAASIANALADLEMVDFAVVLETTADGLIVLAIAGEEPLPIKLSATVPAERARHLIERSRAGAWAEMWADRPANAMYMERLTGRGSGAQAFAPVLSGDEIVGLIAIVTSDDDQAGHIVSDLPFVGEAAAVAGALLAPALMARQHVRSAKVRIADTIASRAFHPVFQPIVDLRTGMTVGFEALTRFANGDSPDRVFADANRAGLGPDLEAATLTAAVQAAARLPRDAWLSLNVSPTLLGECATLAAILADRTRPITLEVTEHETIDDYARLHAAMRTLGPDVRLAVDDAGAGVANFRHLVDLRPDLVKIDAGLVRGVNADISRQALIVGFVHFAEVSGALILAEGLETEAEEETVQRLGVTLGQGFRLARPAPIEHWADAVTTARPAPVLADIISIRKAAKVG
jgi:EAL domain-containing protein (putative c-di-GMP-specific phosphodiesterase class I)